MYETFYGLKDRPFHLAPDPRFLYLTDRQKAAFAHLLESLDDRAPVVVLTGEIGTGKTTFCRSLLEKLPKDTRVATVQNPGLSSHDLLQDICEGFGLPASSSSSGAAGLIDDLQAFLTEQHRAGHRCVAAIDEAQNLPEEALMQIRALTDLEAEDGALLQVLLVGQNQLDDLLEAPGLRGLNQRVVARYHLDFLSHEETLKYVAFRLRVAGAAGGVRFSQPAIKAVYRFSGGTPRVINAICDRALLVAHAQEKTEISPDIVRRAVETVRGVTKQQRPRLLSRLVPSPGAVAAAVILLVAGKFAADRLGFVTWPGPLPIVRSENISSTPALDPADSLHAPATLPVEDPAPPRDLQPIPAVDPRTVELLSRLDPPSALNAAAAALFERWHVPGGHDAPRVDNLPAFAATIREYGLSHEALFPTLDQLAAINLPALVKVTAGSAGLWLALLEVSESTVRLSTAVGDSTVIQRGDFEALYQHQAVIPWRDPTPDAFPLLPAMTGESVQLLQEQLQAAGRLSGEPTGVYDKATVQAVRGLQADTGLNADGKAGRQTRLVLCSWSPAVDTPALRASEQPPTPVEEAS